MILYFYIKSTLDLQPRDNDDAKYILDFADRILEECETTAVGATVGTAMDRQTNTMTMEPIAVSASKIKKYTTAAILFDVVLYLYSTQVENRGVEIEKKSKYCKWKATSLSKDSSGMGGSIHTDQGVQAEVKTLIKKEQNVDVSSLDNTQLVRGIELEKKVRFALNAIQFRDYEEVVHLLREALHLAESLQ